MNWYSQAKLCKELGMSVQTFKKYYIGRFPPDRDTKHHKAWTENSVRRIKMAIEGGNAA